MLKAYEVVREGRDKYLLLGNGFSIGLHHGFHYRSLYEICLDKYFEDEDSELFEKFRTNNFERVLQMLNAARQVNRVLELDTEPIDDRYTQIRYSLAHADRGVHPKKSAVGEEVLERLCDFLRGFRGIFTTNYDLLLYWAIINDTATFVDYFFDGSTFDPTDVEVRWGKVGVHYLHGSLFLYREAGRTRKYVGSVANLLDSLESLITPARTPVFVSEGTSEDKLAAIMSNGYLSFWPSWPK